MKNSEEGVKKLTENLLIKLAINVEVAANLFLPGPYYQRVINFVILQQMGKIKGGQSNTFYFPPLINSWGWGLIQIEATIKERTENN